MTATLDLLLVNPGGRSRVYQSLARSLTAVEPPVWAALMASYARRHGVAAAVLDANAEELDPQEVAAYAAAAAPRLVGVVVYGHQPSASTQVMPAAGAICTAIKQATPTQRVILVGGHVAALPERTLREESADFVAAGEGLVTLVELVAALRAAPAAPALDQVHGLLYRQGAAIRRTAGAPLVRALDDEIPGLAWDLLPMTRYRAHNWHCFGTPARAPYAALYTTLGCPFHCSFCCIQAPFKEGERLVGMKPATNSYRLWSTTTIVDQLELLATTYGVRHVKLADEMFVLNERHVGALCDAITARGLELNLWAYARVDTCRADQLDRLKRAGVNWLAVGIEAGNDRVRADVDKRVAGATVLPVLERVRGAGIHLVANFIFGLPEDDFASMQETLDLALACNAEWANFYCAMAYPGSPLHAVALERGWPLPPTWSGYSQYSVDCLPLPTRHLAAADVLRFRDQAFQRYYRDPAYLALIERQFGAATVAEIRQMLALPLARQHAPDVAEPGGPPSSG